MSPLVRKAVRRIRRHQGHVHHGVILMYHRVTAVGLDPWRLAVAPEHFADQLAVLGRIGRLLTLEQLLADRPTPGNRSVAITVDDAYDDTLFVAAGLLAAHDAPATVFVSTGGVQGDEVCWWDVLAELLLRPGRLPDRLQLTIGSVTGEWRLGNHRDYTAARAAADRGWRADDPPPTARHAAYLDIWGRLITEAPAEQQRVLDALRAQVGSAGRPDGRLLRAEEISRLAAHDHISIGGHTVHHPALPAIDVDAQRCEILENRRQLQRLTTQPVDHFAYPYGRSSPPVARMVADAGYSTAATTDPMPVTQGRDHFVLPRVQVPDYDGPTFERWLTAMCTQVGVW